MPPNEDEAAGARSPTTTVLEIGSAIAVLIDDAASTVEARLVAAQAALRRATGDERIAIGLRDSGRPKLAPPLPELGVSLSRRERILLAGFSPDARVGVDIEIDDSNRGGNVLDPVRLAADHFAPAEARLISQASQESARELFLRLWVAKEAVLKMTGRGVYDGLALPDLSLHVASVCADERMVAVAPSAGMPGFLFAVRRIKRAAFPDLYTALAVEM